MNIESSENKSSKSIGFTIPLIIIILLIAGVGYFVSTQIGLDEDAFKQALDDWSASLEEYSANEDRYMHFEYDDLKMEGGLTDRHAIVSNPRFETELEDKDDDKTTVAIETKTALIYPVAFSLNKARIVLPEPISIESDKEGSVEITAKQAIEIEASQEEENGLPFTTISAKLPTESIVEFSEEDESATVTLDKGGELLTEFTASDRNLGVFNIAANNVKISEKGKSLLSIEAINIESSAISKGDNSYNVLVNASTNQLFSIAEDMPYGAIDAAIKMDYSGPLQHDDEAIDWVDNAVTLSIPSLFIKAGDIDISATVDAKTLGKGDPFPIGKASINVNNLPFIVSELEKNDMLSESDKKIANALLSKAVGHTLDDSDSLKLDITREDGGSLAIGNIPFEQALTIILTGGGAPVQADPNADHTHSHAPEDDGLSIEDAAEQSFKKATEDKKGGKDE